MPHHFSEERPLKGVLFRIGFGRGLKIGFQRPETHFYARSAVRCWAWRRHALPAHSVKRQAVLTYCPREKRFGSALLRSQVEHPHFGCCLAVFGGHSGGGQLQAARQWVWCSRLRRRQLRCRARRRRWSRRPVRRRLERWGVTAAAPAAGVMTSLKSLGGYYASRPKVSLLRHFSLFPLDSSKEEMRLPSAPAPASHPRKMSVVQRTPGLGVASTTPPAVQCLSVTAPAQLAQGRTAQADQGAWTPCACGARKSGKYKGRARVFLGAHCAA
jgi:hypothetical protein